jgi:hypothetical protein
LPELVEGNLELEEASMPSVSVLEKIVRRAPLGLRLNDIVRDVAVTDGLLVQARQYNGDLPPQPALRSPISGVYGFRSLPGLRAYERDERPATDWCNGGSETPNFVVTVEDHQRRFLPQLLLLCLPKTGLVEVPLYSTPSRTNPGGYAVVRGQIWHASADTPASWAVITAAPGDYATVADANGLFSLFLPEPTLATAPAFGTLPLTELQWPLTFQVLYAPATRTTVLTGYPPSTTSIIGQAAANVFDSPGASGTSIVRNLAYGQELLVATTGGSRLLVNPL